MPRSELDEIGGKKSHRKRPASEDQRSRSKVIGERGKTAEISDGRGGYQAYGHLEGTKKNNCPR